MSNVSDKLNEVRNKKQQSVLGKLCTKFKNALKNAPNELKSYALATTLTLASAVPGMASNPNETKQDSNDLNRIENMAEQFKEISQFSDKLWTNDNGGKTYMMEWSTDQGSVEEFNIDGEISTRITTFNNQVNVLDTDGDGKLDKVVDHNFERELSSQEVNDFCDSFVKYTGLDSPMKSKILNMAEQFKSMEGIKVENHNWTNEDGKDCTRTVHTGQYGVVIEDNIGGEEFVTLFAEDCQIHLNKETGKVMNHNYSKELSSEEVASKIKHFSWNSGLEGDKSVSYAQALANMQKAQQSQMDR